ncbi:DUF5068 domain-containing protein [Bacillaceae bacterium SIJ1]|uniref:DUF5068 domain-containing protein n=1 Tax=Litoribacterium kuwaitense TaxID=1398745 RepID=UPI0013E9FFDC|nr:DUF5068 domain-containing protein [Litoribacterium kuwaitense]NGP45632.1 DUF5068 domain-containing protein [Litoribacterium kuwaitense]
MRKSIYLLFTALFLTIVISGCGSETNNESESTDTNEETEQQEDTENETDESDSDSDHTESEEAEEATASDNSSSGSFADAISFMEEQTEGTASVMFESAEPQSHDMEGVTVTLDEYALVELTDFHTDFSIKFDDQTNGGVILAKYTVNNGTDSDAYYMPMLDASYVGGDQFVGNYKDLLPEEEQLPTKLSPSNDYLIKAGEEVTGYYAYPFGEEQLNTIMSQGSIDIQVTEPQSDKDDFGSVFGEKGLFTISLDQASADKAEATASEGFYADRITSQNMGEKTMITNKEGIGDSQTIGDFTVALDGYQFTDFTPNEDEAPRFESFNNGIVLLTVKFNIDNQSDTEVAHSSLTSKLTMNDGSQYTLNEGMLMPYSNDKMIEPGSSGELLQVYPLDKEQYDKIWKDKAFEVELGPMKDKEANDISKGKTATFTLPK